VDSPNSFYHSGSAERTVLKNITFGKNRGQKKVAKMFFSCDYPIKTYFKGDSTCFTTSIISLLYCILSNGLKSLRARILQKDSFRDHFAVADFDENGRF
jgi:hypothetical protein